MSGFRRVARLHVSVENSAAHINRMGSHESIEPYDTPKRSVNVPSNAGGGVLQLAKDVAAPPAPPFDFAQDKLRHTAVWKFIIYHPIDPREPRKPSKGCPRMAYYFWA